MVLSTSKSTSANQMCVLQCRADLSTAACTHGIHLSKTIRRNMDAAPHQTHVSWQTLPLRRNVSTELSLSSTMSFSLTVVSVMDVKQTGQLEKEQGFHHGNKHHGFSTKIIPVSFEMIRL